MLEVRNLNKAYGALKVTDNLNMRVDTGKLHAVIGPNGAGKTSLLTQLAGEMPPDSGHILLDGKDITHHTGAWRCRAGVARTYQITSLFNSFSVLDNARIAAQGVNGHSFSFFAPMRAERTLTERAMEALTAVGLDSQADVIVDELAYGEQRQLEIAMGLVSNPKILLLDEPTAGMGAEDSARVVELVRGLKEKITIVLVEHDMDTVFGLADTISVLVQGREIVCGTPDQVRGNAEVRAHYLGEEHA